MRKKNTIGQGLLIPLVIGLFIGVAMVFFHYQSLPPAPVDWRVIRAPFDQVNLRQDFVKELAEVLASGSEDPMDRYQAARVYNSKWGQATIDHVACDAIFAVPPFVWRWQVEPIPENARLEVKFGVLPNAWADPTEEEIKFHRYPKQTDFFVPRTPIGDGVRLLVEVASDLRPGQVIGEITIDPKHNPDERRWHDVVIDLSPFAGRAPYINFRVDGLENNWEDFAVISRPRIVPIDPEPPVPNIILVVIDTLRADRVGVMNSSDSRESLTPTLDRLARQGQLFTNMMTEVSWTMPAHISLFLSQYPTTHHIYTAPAPYFRLPADQTTLAEVLADAGYSTAAWVGGGYLSPMFGFADGFDMYATRVIETESIGQAVTQWMQNWMTQHADNPFFMFYHTFEAHDYWRRFPMIDPDRAHPAYQGPWRDPDKDLWQLVMQTVMSPYSFTEDERIYMEKLYDLAVAYTDTRISALLTAIEHAGVTENTWLIITSDHGEQFGEQGVFGHGTMLDQSMIHVPLIITRLDRPEQPELIKNDYPAQLVDLMPTILRIAGVEGPSKMEGEVLPIARLADPEQAQKRIRYAEDPWWGMYAVRQADEKYLRYDSALPPVDPHQQLFHIDIDPHEKNNVFEQYPDRSAELDRLVYERRFRNQLGRTVLGVYGPPEGSEFEVEIKIAGKLVDLTGTRGELDLGVDVHPEGIRIRTVANQFGREYILVTEPWDASLILDVTADGVMLPFEHIRIGEAGRAAHRPTGPYDTLVCWEHCVHFREPGEGPRAALYFVEGELLGLDRKKLAWERESSLQMDPELRAQLIALGYMQGTQHFSTGVGAIGLGEDHGWVIFGSDRFLEPYEQGMHALRAGDHDTAAQKLQQALEAYPNFQPARKALQYVNQ